MKLLQLKIFKDVAYSSSFVKAARMNFITQPSVSIHIKQLEAELRVKLFDRTPKKVTLTPYGILYLPHAEEILEKCDNFLALSSGVNSSIQGHLRIASIHSIGMHSLGGFLKVFMQKYPGIQIHLEYQEALNIYELVQKRKVQIGMVAHPSEHLRLESIIYSQDELGLIAPPQHRLAHKRNIYAHEFANENFIAFDLNSPTRKQIDLFLKKNKTSVNIKMVSNNIFTLKKAVEAGLGISIVPLNTVGSEVERGLLRKIKLRNARLYRPLSIITPKKEPGKIEEIFTASLLSFYKIQN